MTFNRLTPDKILALGILLILAAFVLAVLSAYWRMDIQCGALCNGVHMLKGVVIP